MLAKGFGEAETLGVLDSGCGARFSELIDWLPIAAYAIDVEGRVTYFNRAAARLVGREPQIGSDRWCISWKLYRPDGSFLPHDECLLAVALKELRNIRGAEAIVKRPDGGCIWVEAYPTIIYGKDGQAEGAINVLIDITDRKKAAEGLAESNRRKSEFLAQLAHELRNPLAAISSAVTALLLPSENSASDRGHALLSIAHRQLNHVTRLVDDLLQVSRIDSGKIALKKQSVDLADVLRHAIETALPEIERRGHILNVKLLFQPLQLDADPVRLSQVFADLLSNAAKFTQDAGVVELTGERRSDQAIITVRDNGVGISAEMLPRVFDMFAQQENTQRPMQGGLRIGLALAKNVVELHGGKVEVHSDGVGRGSKYVIHLPIADHNEMVDHSKKESAGIQGPIKTDAMPRVLVVDDDHEVADSLGMLLEAVGAEVRVAYSGAEGLKTLMAFEPGLVLIDICMPEMDGYETARRFRTLPGRRAAWARCRL